MSALPTEAVVAVLAVAALALLAALAWAADRLTATPAPRRRASAQYAGHDLMPAHVALVHDPACRACAVYDRTLDEGIDALEDLANGERGAA